MGERECRDKLCNEQMASQTVLTTKYVSFWVFSPQFTSVSCKHLRSLSLAKISNVPLDWSDAYLLHWQRFLNQQYLVICALEPWLNKLSRSIRPKVVIHRSCSSSLYLSHDLEIRRVIYHELSPFAVKPMFWFSVWNNQITGNFISSSDCVLLYLFIEIK